MFHNRYSIFFSSPSTPLVPCMGLYLVAAFFNPCVNCFVFLILALYSDVYEGEYAGCRTKMAGAVFSVSIILESFLALCLY